MPPAPAPRLSTTTCLPSCSPSCVREQAADHVVAAAGRERNDQPHRPVRIVVRRARRRRREQRAPGAKEVRLDAASTIPPYVVSSIAIGISSPATRRAGPATLCARIITARRSICRSQALRQLSVTAVHTVTPPSRAPAWPSRRRRRAGTEVGAGRDVARAHAHEFGDQVGPAGEAADAAMLAVAAAGRDARA